ncbi:peptidyl-prolyl isomerase [Pycnococcus provasolii]
MELEFEVGDGTAMLGVDHAVKSMRVGDVVRLRLRGEATLPDVPAELPPGTDLAYEELHVELILDKAGAARVDKFSMKARDKVSLAEDLRQRANALYKAGRIERAIKTYERGIDMFNSLQAEGDRERGTYDAAVADANRQCRKAQVPFYLNAALARVKLGRFAEARDDMLELFDLDDVTSDDERAKAHFRMGQAQVGLLDYAEAQRSFRRAMELAPSLVCADATRELKRVAQLQAAQDAKDRAVVSSALAKKQRETNGNVFYTEHEKSAISEPYRRALPKKTERAAERIDNLEAEIADIEEDEEEVDRKRREDWYNGMIRSGNMKVHMG